MTSVFLTAAPGYASSKITALLRLLLSKKAPQKSLDGKMSARWSDGLFLGFSRDSNEFVLWNYTEKKIARAGKNISAWQALSGHWKAKMSGIGMPVGGAITTAHIPHTYG